MDEDSFRPLDGIIIDPPWVVAPGLPTAAPHWRQGDLEEYLRCWFVSIECQPREKALKYLRNIDPPEEGFWAEEIGKYLNRMEGEDWEFIRAKAISQVVRRDEQRRLHRLFRERNSWRSRFWRWFGKSGMR